MDRLTLPEAQKGLKDATVSRWLKQPGEKVSKGDILVELQAERATVQVQADRDGMLAEVLAPEGATVKVGAPLATIAGVGEAVRPAARVPVSQAQPSPAGNGDASKATLVVMPQASNTMEEGTILKWLVKPGDTIAVGQVIFEAETDKATVEVEATDAGRLARIVASEGDIVPVMQPVAVLADNDVDADALLATEGGAAATAARVPVSQAQPSPAGNGDASKATLVVMPQASNTMEEGTILKWLVKPGDTIAVGQVIFEAETDKATVEVEATDAGRLARIVASEGDIVPVMQPVAVLADNDADADALLATEGGTTQAAAAAVPPSPAASAPASSSVSRTETVSAAPAVTTGGNGRVKASPAARRIASERGIDLAVLGVGSGPGGRIISTDVPAQAPTAAAAVAPEARPTTTGEPVRRKLAGMRKAIARNLSKSKQTIPHFYIESTIDAEPMMTFYRREKAKYRLSVNDVIVKACAKAIGEFSAFRSQIDGEEIVEFPNANIGVAVGMENGLVVPVILAAETLSMQQLGAESRRLVEAARNGKIENMGQGVFTISNLGMFGTHRFSAIINPPEAAILAVGAVREEVIVSGGTMRPGQVMTMTLSCDHRVIDGLAAAKFLARVKEILEAPELLLG